MILLDLDPVLAGHLAIALEHHRRRLRAEHRAMPDGFDELAAMARREAMTVPDSSFLDGARNVSDNAVMTSAPLLLTLDEAVVVLGLSMSTVKRLAASGELPRVNVGRAVRVHRDDLEAFAARLRDRVHATKEAI